MLIDSHCHLDFPEFEHELNDVVARADEAGIGAMLTICTRVTKFEAVRAVAERFKNIYCSVGIHPHNVAEEPEISAEHLVRMADHAKVIGFGESGLDYYYDHSPRERQQACFRIHIAAARQAGLPVIIHARDADEEMAHILEDEYAKGAFGGVLHCFSSSRQLADRALALGLYVSFSGIVTFKNADEVRQTARDVPLERLLVETDAPYLAPVPMRGKRNEPAFTAHTAAKVAELRGMSEAELAAATTANFYRLFSKARIPEGQKGQQTGDQAGEQTGDQAGDQK